jgi:environmental stress-induced protein Ves
VADTANNRVLAAHGGSVVSVDLAMKTLTPGLAPGAWNGVIWRFGQTRIERPGPFSDLSGFDRLLAVIEGQGLVLHPVGAPALDVRERFQPVRFPGEWQIESELENGPVAVINLMADRRRATIDLRFATGIAQLAFEPGTLVLYAAAGASTVELSGDFIELAPADAVQVESAGPIAITLRSGVIAAAWISVLSPR